MCEFNKVLILSVLFFLSAISSVNAQPTLDSVKKVGVEDAHTISETKPYGIIGPPRHLITTEPHTTISSLPRINVIPGAEVTLELPSERPKIVWVKDQTPIPGATTVREAAEEYLKMHHAVLGLSEDLSDLRFEEVKEMNPYHRVEYRQVYEGLPVMFGYVNVIVFEDLRISKVNLHVIPINVFPPDLNTNPTNGEAAIVEALRIMKATRVKNPQATTEAVVLVKEGVPVVAWRIRFLNKKFDELNRWEVMMNASTLEMIEARDLRN